MPTDKSKAPVLTPRSQRVEFVRGNFKMSDADLASAMMKAGLYSKSTVRGDVVNSIGRLRRDAEKRGLPS